jgi:hypothetical protein
MAVSIPEPVGTNKLSESGLEEKRAKWKTEFADIMSGVPPVLPPLRDINHEIPLIDKKIQYNYHLPKCPEPLRKTLLEKINQYCDAGWWTYEPAKQAAPMLLLPKY